LASALASVTAVRAAVEGALGAAADEAATARRAADAAAPGGGAILAEHAAQAAARREACLAAGLAELKGLAAFIPAQGLSAGDAAGVSGAVVAAGLVRLREAGCGGLGPAAAAAPPAPVNARAAAGLLKSFRKSFPEPARLPPLKAPKMPKGYKAASKEAEAVVAPPPPAAAAVAAAPLSPAVREEALVKPSAGGGGARAAFAPRTPNSKPSAAAASSSAGPKANPSAYTGSSEIESAEGEAVDAKEKRKQSAPTAPAAGAAPWTTPKKAAAPPAPTPPIVPTLFAGKAAPVKAETASAPPKKATPRSSAAAFFLRGVISPRTPKKAGGSAVTSPVAPVGPTSPKSIWEAAGIDTAAVAPAAAAVEEVARVATPPPPPPIQASTPPPAPAAPVLQKRSSSVAAAAAFWDRGSMASTTSTASGRTSPVPAAAPAAPKIKKAPSPPPPPKAVLAATASTAPPTPEHMAAATAALTEAIAPPALTQKVERRARRSARVGSAGGSAADLPCAASTTTSAAAGPGIRRVPAVDALTAELAKALAPGVMTANYAAPSAGTSPPWARDRTLSADADAAESAAADPAAVASACDRHARLLTKLGADVGGLGRNGGPATVAEAIALVADVRSRLGVLASDGAPAGAVLARLGATWPAHKWKELQAAADASDELATLERKQRQWVMQRGSAAAEGLRIEAFLDSITARCDALAGLFARGESRLPGGGEWARHGIPSDSTAALAGVRTASLHLAHLALSRCLVEVAALERDAAAARPGAALAHLADAVRVASKAQDFAGGLDGEAAEDFDKVRRLTKYYMRVVAPEVMKDAAKLAAS